MEIRSLRGGHTFYGVTLYIVGEHEEPRHLVARGHLTPVRFVAACNAFLRTEWGWRDMMEARPTIVMFPTLMDVLEDVRYVHGRFYLPEDGVPDEEDEETFNWEDYYWYLSYPLQPEEERAEPLTIWSI